MPNPVSVISSYTEDNYEEYHLIYLGDPGHLAALYKVLVYISSIIGILTNTFVIIVISRFKRAQLKLASILMIHQSVIDLYNSALVLLTYSTWFADLSYRVTGNIWSWLYCLFLHNETLLYMGFYTNSFNVMLMAIERFLMIVCPLFYRAKVTFKKVLMLIGLSWVVSISLNVPSMAATTLHPFEYCYYGLTYNSQAITKVHGCFIMILTYILPLASVLCLGISMSSVLWIKGRGTVNPLQPQHTTQSPKQMKNKALTRTQRNLHKIITIISLIFLLTWSPIQIYYFMYNLGLPLSFSDAFYYVGMSVAIINSTVNPFIYIFKFRQFRATMRTMFCLKKNQTEERGADGKLALPAASPGTSAFSSKSTVDVHAHKEPE